MRQIGTYKVFQSLGIAAVLFYLGYHALHGEQGVYALLVESGQKARLEQELADIREEREALEHRVDHLRSACLDADLLDEQARQYLGVAKEGEFLLIE